MKHLVIASTAAMAAGLLAACATTASAPDTPEAASDACVSEAYADAFQGTDVYDFSDIGTLASALRREENPTGRVSEDTERRLTNTLSQQYVGTFMSRYQPCMVEALENMESM